MSPLMSQDQCAQWLGVSRRQMQNLVHDRVIPFLLVGSRRRFDKDQVLAALPSFGPHVKSLSSPASTR